MKESTVTDRVTMTWITVLDASGRPRLESRWVATSEALAPHVTHAA